MNNSFKIMGGDESHITIENKQGQQVAVITGECPAWPKGINNVEEVAKLFVSSPDMHREVVKLLDIFSSVPLSNLPLTAQRQLAKVRQIAIRQNLSLEEFNKLSHE